MGSVTRYIQNSFTSGELTPRLTARDDYQRYASGVKEMVNFIPLPHGGAKTRPGTVYVSRTRANGQAVLIPFEHSTPQAYMLEFGEQYVRFFKNGAHITDASGTITGAANNGVGLIRITSVAHGLASGHYVSITGVKGTTEANDDWQITFVNADTYDLVGSTFTNAYTSGGTWKRPYTVTTPFTVAADLTLIRWAQAGNTMYMAHPSFLPRKLVRTTDTSWTFTEFTGSANFVDGPYMDANTDTSKTLTCSTATAGASGTVTAAGHTPWTGDSALYDGSLYRIKVGANWGYIRLTGKVSSTVYNMTVVLALGGVTATSDWREGSFSGSRGFPRAITVFEQRLAFAGTAEEPQNVWLSSSGSYEDFSPSAVNGTVAADDGITYRLGSNKLNKIHWLLGARDLMIGTIGEEFFMRGSGTGDALTPVTAPTVRSGTAYGSSTAHPARIGHKAYYIQRSKRKVRSLAYNFDEDNYLSPDISLTAEHMLRDKDVTVMAYQLEPDSVLWVLRSDGLLLSFTIHELEQVYGWARQQTDGTVESIAAIPSIDGASDSLWLIVNRTVTGGATKRFVEYTDPNYNMDAGITYDGRLAATLTPGATSGNDVTFTASAPVFTSADVGKDLITLAYEVGGVTYYARATIDLFNSATSVRADITVPFPNTSAIPQGSWALAISTVPGLDHINGKTVDIVGDGAVYEDAVVSSGQATLTDNATVGPAAGVIRVGLPRTPNPKIVTLQPAFKDDAGAVRNKWKHWATVEVAVDSTAGLTINEATDIDYRTPSDPMDVATPAFTGDKIIPQRFTTRRGELTFEQKQPLYALLLAYFGELEVGD